MTYIALCMLLYACNTLLVLDHIGEHHAVAWLPDFTMPTHPGYVGALVDNDPRVGELVRLMTGTKTLHVLHLAGLPSLTPYIRRPSARALRP